MYVCMYVCIWAKISWLASYSNINNCVVTTAQVKVRGKTTGQLFSRTSFYLLKIIVAGSIIHMEDTITFTTKLNIIEFLVQILMTTIFSRTMCPAT